MKSETRRTGWWSAAGAALPLMALVLSACNGPPPESPTTSFRSETIGLAESVKVLPCGVSRVTLAAGDVVEMVPTGYVPNNSTPCPGSSAPEARLLFGANKADNAKRRLFFYGHLPDGQPFYAWASQDSLVASCAAGTYMVAGGAFEDGGTFHLPNGLVLDKAPGFDRGGLRDPAVVTADAWLCVDSSGRVMTIGGPPYM